MKYLVIGGATLLLLMFTNMSSISPSLKPKSSQLRNEYFKIHEKINSFKYGEKGGTLMKSYLTRTAQALTTSESLQSCYEVTSIIPQLYTSTLVFRRGKKLSRETCVSRATTVVVTHSILN